MDTGVQGVALDTGAGDPLSTRTGNADMRAVQEEYARWMRRTHGEAGDTHPLRLLLLLDCDEDERMRSECERTLACAAGGASVHAGAVRDDAQFHTGAMQGGRGEAGTDAGTEPGRR